MLENLGWRIHRIWSWDWVRERHREVARLQSAIKAAIDAAGPAAPQASLELSNEADPAIEREKEEVLVNEVRGPHDAVELPWVVPYEAAPLEGFSTHLEMHEPAARPILMKALDALMEVESRSTMTTRSSELLNLRELRGVDRWRAAVEHVGLAATR